MYRLRPCHDHACFGRNGVQPERFGPLWEDVQLDLRGLRLSVDTVPGTRRTHSELEEKVPPTVSNRGQKLLLGPGRICESK